MLSLDYWRGSANRITTRCAKIWPPLYLSSPGRVSPRTTLLKTFRNTLLSGSTFGKRIGRLTAAHHHDAQIFPPLLSVDGFFFSPIFHPRNPHCMYAKLGKIRGLAIQLHRLDPSNLKVHAAWLAKTAKLVDHFPYREKKRLAGQKLIPSSKFLVLLNAILTRCFVLIKGFFGGEIDSFSPVTCIIESQYRFDQSDPHLSSSLMFFNFEINLA